MTLRSAPRLHGGGPTCWLRKDSSCDSTSGQKNKTDRERDDGRDDQDDERGVVEAVDEQLDPGLWIGDRHLLSLFGGGEARQKGTDVYLT